MTVGITRQELSAAAQECQSQTEIARRLGCSISTVRYRARKLDIFLPIGKRGPAGNGLEDKVRAEEIVAMRRLGLNYDLIGQHFRISRERVRQMLLVAAPELCGTCVALGLKARAKGHKKHCNNCRGPFWTKNRGGNFCSKKCSAAAKRNTKRHKKAYELRISGLSWREVGERLWGADGYAAAARAAMAVKRYGKQNGIDVSGAFGFDARGRASPWTRKDNG